MGRVNYRADDLMNEIRGLGLDVAIAPAPYDPGTLLLTGPKDRKTPDLIAKIKRHKAELIELLKRGELTADTEGTAGAGTGVGGNRGAMPVLPGSDLLPSRERWVALQPPELPPPEGGPIPGSRKPISLQTVGEWRAWLESETAKLRAELDESERWIAKWELDGTQVEELEGAHFMYDLAARAWVDHLELLDWFSKWSSGVLKRHLQEANEFAFVRR